MAGETSWREASTALVVSSETMPSAASDRSSSRHSHRICRVQARAQPGAVGTAPRSSTARSARPASAGGGGWSRGCMVSLLNAVLMAMEPPGLCY
jgi:hypothetical protein